MKASLIIKIAFTILLGTSSILHAQTLIDEIKISDLEKNITNLSGKINENISFHLIINKVKNKNIYNSTVYIYGKEKRIMSFPTKTTTIKPKYLTFHVNDHVLTIFNNADNTVEITDYDYVKNKQSSVKFSRRITSIFSHENATFLIYGSYVNKIRSFQKIINTNNISNYMLTTKDKTESSFLNDLTNSKKCEFINDIPFIDKGSIMMYKGFYRNNELVFLKDDRKNSNVTVFTINEKGLFSKTINIANGKAIKQASFLKDSLLVTFNMNQKVSHLFIHDINTLKLENYFTYSKNKFGLKNKLIHNGLDQTTTFKSKQFYKGFFRIHNPDLNSFGSTNLVFSAISRYNPGLYVNVNKSKDNRYIIEVGHVDQNKYNNSSSFNFWWLQPAFNLNFVLFDGTIFEDLAIKKRKGNYFELNLDTNLKQTKDTLTPKKYHLNKKKYYDRYTYYKHKLKKHFFIPLKDNVRLIEYIKNEKVYKIYNLKKQ